MTSYHPSTRDINLRDLNFRLVYFSTKPYTAGSQSGSKITFEPGHREHKTSVPDIEQ